MNVSNQNPDLLLTITTTRERIPFQLKPRPSFLPKACTQYIRFVTCMTECTRDFTQAYIQPKTPLERQVFIRPHAELGLEHGHILCVVQPLYGIPKSGLNWYLTYLEHHLKVLNMTRTKEIPCVLIRQTNDELDGMVILQVEDSLGIGTSELLKDE